MGNRGHKAAREPESPAVSEATSLLQRSDKSYRSTRSTGRLTTVCSTLEEQALSLHIEGESECVGTYKASNLGTWRAFLYVAGTIWTKRTFWQNQACLMLIATGSAFVSWFLCPYVKQGMLSQFDAVAKLFAVLVTFLLGYFLKSSVDRWSRTVDGFLLLGNSVRNLMVQMHGHRTAAQEADCALRPALPEVPHPGAAAAPDRDPVWEGGGPRGVLVRRAGGPQPLGARGDHLAEGPAAGQRDTDVDLDLHVHQSHGAGW